MNSNFLKISTALCSLYLFGCAAHKETPPARHSKASVTNHFNRLDRLDGIDSSKGFRRNSERYSHNYSCPISGLDELHRSLYYQSKQTNVVFNH